MPPWAPASLRQDRLDDLAGDIRQAVIDDDFHADIRIVRQQLHRLEENLDAAAIELTADDLRDIDAAVSKIDVEGERYPPFLAAMVDR